GIKADMIQRIREHSTKPASKLGAPVWSNDMDDEPYSVTDNDENVNNDKRDNQVIDLKNGDRDTSIRTLRERALRTRCNNLVEPSTSNQDADEPDQIQETSSPTNTLPKRTSK
ncbi:25069_t:CDS:1, partial [Racocetra persica]